MRDEIIESYNRFKHLLKGEDQAISSKPVCIFVYNLKFVRKDIVQDFKEIIDQFFKSYYFEMFNFQAIILPQEVMDKYFFLLMFRTV